MNIRQDVAELLNKTKSIVVLLTGIVLLITLLFLGIRIFPIDEYWLNIFTEFLSIVATIGVLNEIAKYRETRQRHTQTIENVSSPVQAIAVTAASSLLRNGYLQGKKSELRDKDLSHADLRRVRLPNSNLDGTIMRKVKLDECYLREASLQGVDLSVASVTHADLSGAEMHYSTLVGANLTQTDLTYVKFVDAMLLNAILVNCNLSHANLEGANLKNTNLKGANMDEVKCNHRTILPDDQFWHEGVDWRAYTT